MLLQYLMFMYSTLYIVDLVEEVKAVNNGGIQTICTSTFECFIVAHSSNGTTILL